MSLWPISTRVSPWGQGAMGGEVVPGEGDLLGGRGERECGEGNEELESARFFIRTIMHRAVSCLTHARLRWT